MNLPATPPSNILASAIALYVAATVWAVIRGPDTFLTGLLSGAGSIALGVWIGVAITTTPREPIPPMEEDW